MRLVTSAQKREGQKAFLCKCFVFVLVFCFALLARTTLSKADEYDSWRQEILDLVNEERSSRGLSTLSYYKTLDPAAQLRAEESAQKFSHTRPNGEQWKTVFDEFGIASDYRGENLAYGQKSAQQVMEAWMNSKGHRANILDERFTHISVGIYNKDGKIYYSQLFMEGNESMQRTGVSAALTPAEVGKSQSLSGTSLTLRNSPDFGAGVVAVLKQGDTLTIESIDMATNWAYISSGGNTGYAFSFVYEGTQYLEAPPGLSLSAGTNELEALPPASVGATAQVTGVNLNMREEPSKEAAIVDVAREGEAAKVEKIENGWAYIVLDEARSGWVSTYFMRVPGA